MVWRWMEKTMVSKDWKGPSRHQWMQDSMLWKPINCRYSGFMQEESRHYLNQYWLFWQNEACLANKHYIGQTFGFGRLIDFWNIKHLILMFWLIFSIGRALVCMSVRLSVRLLRCELVRALWTDQPETFRVRRALPPWRLSPESAWSVKV